MDNTYNAVKYFGIGLSRTGTTSLYSAFKMLGFRSAHYPRPIQMQKAQLYDFMNDTPVPIRFKELDKRFPGSKFIYTVRDVNAWVKSCSEYFSSDKAQCIKPRFDWQMQYRIETYGLTEFDEEIFTMVYNEHDQDVRNYFKDRPDDLLIMDVTKGDGWEKLLPFIVKNSPNASMSLPHTNKIVKLDDRKRAVVKKRLSKYRKEGPATTVFPNVDVPDNQDEVRLFSVVKNEILRISNFLDYYRSLGVKRFFIVDNNSSDGTFEYLAEQTDVHVFATNESFYFEKQWIESLLEKYGQGHWCMLSDADEMFTYPLQEKVSLQDLCSYLDSSGYNAVDSLLIDLYANAPMSESHYVSGENPLKTFKYFDKDSHTETTSKKIINNNSGAKAYRGGVQKRVFNRNYQLNKVCLFKMDEDIELVTNGHHYLRNACISPIRGAVLHFKFASDLLKRAEIMKEDEEYYSMHYTKYYRVLSDLPEINLYNDDSCQYLGSQQLIDLGIMTVSEEYLGACNE